MRTTPFTCQEFGKNCVTMCACVRHSTEMFFPHSPAEVSIQLYVVNLKNNSCLFFSLYSACPLLEYRLLVFGGEKLNVEWELGLLLSQLKVSFSEKLDLTDSTYSATTHTNFDFPSLHFTFVIFIIIYFCGLQDFYFYIGNLWGAGVVFDFTKRVHLAEQWSSLGYFTGYCTS